MPTLVGPFAPPFRRRKRSASGTTTPPAPSPPSTPNTPSPTNAGTALYTLLSWLAAGQARADVYVSLIASAVSYVAAVLADGPVGYWRLGDVAGAAKDETTGQHHGTYVNSPTLQAAGAISESNTAVMFTAASSQRVTFGDVSTFEFSGAFSVESWIKFTSAGLMAVTGKLSSAPDGYTMYVVGGNVAFIGYSGGLTRFNPTSAAAYNNGAFHHCVFTWDGTTGANTVKLYVDSVLVSFVTSSAVAPIGTGGAAEFQIASDQSGADYFDGTIDDVAVYNYELTSTQIANHYAQRLAGPPVSVHQSGVSYVPTLLPSKTYYWQVIASNDGGQTAGPIWSFSTLAATEWVFTAAGTRVYPIYGGWSIADQLNAAANTARGMLRTAVTIGQEILIGLGTLDANRLLFAGEVQQPDQSYLAGKPANVCYPINAIDYTFQFNRRRPFGTFVNQSVTLIAKSLIAQFAPGFTSNGVQNDLPATSMIFDGSEDFGTALTRLATSIRAYYGGPDYARDVRLFFTDTSDAPNPIDGSHPCLNDPPITVSRDLSQLRNKVFGKGHGETVPCDVATGDTILPIADAVMFSATGGSAIAGTTPEGAQSQVLTYAGIHLGGAGSLTGPGVAPSVAMTPTISSGSGIETGAHQYAYTWVTGSGESLPSPTATVTNGPLSNPVAAPTGFTPSVAFSGALNPGGSYRVKYVYVTDVPQTQRTLASPASSAIIANANGDAFATVPYSTNASVLYVFTYRTVDGGATYYLYTSNANNPAGGTVDVDLGGTSDATLVGLAQEPVSNTTALNQTTLAGIAVGPTGTTQRKVYRTVAAGSQLKLQQTIANNTATTGTTDATADAGLGANAPSSDTSGLATTPGQINAGSTSILTASAAAFPVNGGWVLLAGDQTVRYTGVSANTLTGVPASGPGAVITTVPYGSQILPAPALTGINHSNGLPLAMAKGSAVHIWVERNDYASQALYGVHEHLISDERFSEALIAATCDADLALFKDPIVTVRYDTRDPKTRSGKTVHIDLPAPTSLTGDFTIQDVTITAEVPTIYPRYSVVASSVRFSFDDMLRRVLLSS